jgi:hypothetical protein
MIRKGRPSKAAVAERKRLKAEAAARDRFREDMESKIAQGRVEVIEWEDAVVRSLMGEKLPDDCLLAAPPIGQFLYRKLRDVPAEEKQEEAYCAALVDLLLSDVLYLHSDGTEVEPHAVRKAVRWVACQIAAMMKIMKSTPKERRLAEDRAFIDYVTDMKEYLAGQGLTMGEAEQQIASSFGWKGRNTLLRKVRMARARCAAGQGS